jgi:hypothetical protein
MPSAPAAVQVTAKQHSIGWRVSPRLSGGQHLRGWIRSDRIRYSGIGDDSDQPAIARGTVVASHCLDNREIWRVQKTGGDTWLHEQTM